MKGLLIAASLVVCCLARPDIGLKLREAARLSPPATSYGVPSGSYIPSAPSTTFNTPNQQGGFSSVNHGYARPITGGGQPNFAGGHGYTSGSSGSSGFSSTSGSFGGHQEYTSGSANSGFGHTSSSGGSDFASGQDFSGGFSQFGTSGSGSSSGFASSGHQTGGSVEVQKHIYFYDSPEDEPAPQIRIHQEAAPAKKNYKIIFIKTPTYKTPEIQLPVQQQDSEKTIVYVLVKKQEDGQDIVIPSAAASKPSKPDVFFIRYKTQKEAEEKIHRIQQGDLSSGISASDVGSDSALVSTIKDSQIGTSHIGSAAPGYDSSSHGTSSGGSIYPGATHGSSESAHHNYPGTILTTGHSHSESSHTNYPGSGGDSHYHGTDHSNTISTEQNHGPAGISGPYY